MKHTLKVFLLLGAVVVCLSLTNGETPRLSSTAMADTCMVGGVISTNTTWSTAQCDTYVVYGNLLVDQGATLTIMPGVVVAVMQGFRVEVRGALKARGTALDSIVFTSYKYPPYPGDWQYIKFRNTSIDSACSLHYCRIEYSTYGVYCDTAAPTISHCTITKSSSCGVCGQNGSPRIVQNKIVLCSTEGIAVCGGGSPTTYGNVIESNYYGILVYPNASPYIEADTITQNTLYGILISGGYVTATIIFCEITDQTSNAGIYVDSYYGNISIVNNSISGNNNGGVWANTPNGSTTIRNNLISGNTGNLGGGIYVNSSGGSATIDSNCIIGNSATGAPIAAGGIYFDVAGNVSVNYNDIYGNSDKNNLVSEVYSGIGSSDIQGQNNWWGTTDSVIIANLVYDYYDNFDLRKFIFAPFATSPHCEIWIKVMTPNGGEILCSDSSYQITWSSGGAIDSVAIGYSPNGGSSWIPITASTPNDGSYSWIVPNTPSQNCLVKISDAKDGDPADTSDGYFTIVSQPTIAVKSPNGRETWRVSTSHDIKWDHFCFHDSVIIEYTTNGGTSWNTIVASTTNHGSYAWTIPNTPSDSCLIRISHVVDGIPSDQSDSFFSIVTWIRGDANGDGVINVSDVVYLINYLFIGGPPPVPLQAGDINCDGTINVSDVVYLINYLFISGPPPGC